MKPRLIITIALLFIAIIGFSQDNTIDSIQLFKANALKEIDLKADSVKEEFTYFISDKRDSIDGAISSGNTVIATASYFLAIFTLGLSVAGFLISRGYLKKFNENIDSIKAEEKDLKEKMKASLDEIAVERENLNKSLIRIQEQHNESLQSIKSNRLIFNDFHSELINVCMMLLTCEEENENTPFQDAENHYEKFIRYSTLVGLYQDKATTIFSSLQDVFAFKPKEIDKKIMMHIDYIEALLKQEKDAIQGLTEELKEDMLILIAKIKAKHTLGTPT